MKQFIFPIFIMLFMHTAITEAQTTFVQSRYIGAPALATCSDCSIADDGTTHIRFKPGSIRVDTDEGRVELTVEMRRVGGPEGAERHISAAAFRLKYPTAIFGDNLNDPDIQAGDSSQCTFVRSDLFPAMKEVEVLPDVFVPQSAYTLSFLDSFSDELNVDETHASAAVAGAPRGAFSTLGAEWENMITLSCEIPSGQTDSDAGLAIGGSQPAGLFYRRYPDGPGASVAATAFLVADNDLRGLRLDGKTWAEDYARYGDGMGVRIQFSKGIKDQLGADNFALSSGEANTMTVVHEAGSEWAHVRFEEPVSGDTLELVSNATAGLVTDVDDNELADGNFLASLAYDAAAPRVTAAAEDSAHTGEGELKWDVTFSSALQADIAIPDNVCLAEGNACGDTSLPSIVSTALNADGTQLSVIIDGGGRGTGAQRVDKVGGTFSLELRRNSILGADLKVAEDYQGDLRDVIELTDGIGPAITVVADGPAVPILTASELMVAFTVTADEDTPNLSSTSSYKLIGITGNGIEETTVAPTAITSDLEQKYRMVRIEYAIPFDSVPNLDSISAFTLARGSADDSLADAGGNAPTDANGDPIDVDTRIDNSDAALATRGTAPPTIAVVALNNGQVTIETPDDPANNSKYSMMFSIQADEDVRGIDMGDSYSVVRVLRAGGYAVVESGATAQAEATDTIGTKSTVTFNVEISREDSALTEGFTLGQGMGLQDLDGNNPVVVDAVSRVLDASEAAIAQVGGITCAAFYPNIGQRSLFFEIIGEVNLNGLELSQGGNSISGFATALIGDSVIKATLNSGITNAEDIVAMYKANAAASPLEALCEADIATADKDDDGKIDVVDANPFDPTNNADNPEVVGPLGPQPGEKATGMFYSRNGIVRTLIRGEAFTYIASGDSSRKEFTRSMRISPSDYFGVEITSDTRILRLEVGGECQGILASAQEFQLNRVRISEFCVDVSDNMASEPVGERGYAWVEIDDNGILASDYREYLGVKVLPEINFSGQSSYMYAINEARSVVISAYVADTMMGVSIPVQDTLPAGSEMQTADLSSGIFSSEERGMIGAFYHITEEGRYPTNGQTITRWLDGSGAANIWHPASEADVSMTAGGYDLEAIDYVVGSNNNIDIRTAVDGTAEPVTLVKQILLYEANDSGIVGRVSSMVAGRSYYVVADVMTNIPNTEEMPMEVVVASELVDGYQIGGTDMAELIAAVDGAGHTTGEYIDVIEITVDDDAAGTIGVGWRSIGNVRNVKATYLVTSSAPEAYGLADGDGDRIPDSVDTNPTSATVLQVASDGTNADDLLRTDTTMLSDMSKHQKLTVSDAGLIVAMAGDLTAVAYSAANIMYADLSEDTKGLLGLADTADALEESGTPLGMLSTFGVQDVINAITVEESALGSDDEEAPMMVHKATGGVAYVSFPLNAPSLMGETLYLGKFNPHANRWERFERGTKADYPDTWYAIGRGANQQCPANREVYRNEHKVAGKESLGFVSSGYDCIMAVISDGGPYDSKYRGLSGGLGDGRVIDPLVIGTQLFPKGVIVEPVDPVGPADGRRGGGSAIGIADIALLLAGLLLLLAMASRRGRKV